MKLYLSSYRVPTPDDLFALLPKSPRQTTVAVIPNAKDYHEPELREFKLSELNRDLQDLGFRVDFIDLRGYHNKEKLLTKLMMYSLLWVGGGNNFVLRYEMKRSGLDQIIHQLLEAGIVYGGESAGAIVAGPTLKGFEGADDPAFASKVIWEGLGLTSHIIIPHADNPELKGKINKIRELYKHEPRAVILNDNQALVINGTSSFITSTTPQR